MAGCIPCRQQTINTEYLYVYRFRAVRREYLSIVQRAMCKPSDAAGTAVDGLADQTNGGGQSLVVCG